MLQAVEGSSKRALTWLLRKSSIMPWYQLALTSMLPRVGRSSRRAAAIRNWFYKGSNSTAILTIFTRLKRTREETLSL
jgi:hypothetical protein